MRDKTRSRRLAPWLALLGLAGLAWWTSSRWWSPAHTASLPTAEENGRPAPPTSLELLSPPGPDPRSEQRASLVAPSHWDGRIRMLDGTSVSGTLSARVTPLSGPAIARILAVEQDAWRVQSAGVGDRLLVADLELGGRRAYALRSLHVLGEHDPLVIEADWAPPTGVRVVDADTWEELTEVELLDCSLPEHCRQTAAFHVHPGISAPATTRAPAPLVTDDWRLMSRHLVTAPGYAWGSVSRLAGGEVVPSTVVLRKGCELIVRVEGTTAASGAARLLLHDQARTTHSPAYVLEVPAGPGEHRFGHLEQGTYRARLENGGAARCDLAPMQVVSVAPLVPAQLTFELPSPGGVTLVAGLVHVSAGTLGAEITAIRLHPVHLICGEGARDKITLGVADGALERGAGGALEWQPRALLPGTWYAELAPLGLMIPFTVPALPFNLLELWPPAPIELSVWVLDALTREPRPFDALFVASLRVSDAGAILQAPLQGRAPIIRERDPLRMQVYPGVVRFSVISLSAGDAHFVRELHESGDVVLEMSPRVPVMLSALAFGSGLELSHSRWATLQVRTPEDELVVGGTLSFPSGFPSATVDLSLISMQSPLRAQAVLHLPAPGSYVLELMGARMQLELGAEELGGREVRVVFDLSSAAGL